MTDGTRRDFFRTAAPAVALPMVAAMPQGKEAHLVTQDEIMSAFRLYDRMELAAEDLNLRYQLIIEMLFETNPERLREKLQVLRDKRRERSVLVDVNTGQTVPFDESMYNELGQVKMPVPRELPTVTGPHIPAVRSRKNKLRSRLAKALRKKVIGV